MTLGLSVFLVVVGATLRYALTWRASGVDLPVLGLILMVAGIVTAVICVLRVVLAPGAQATGQQPAPPRPWATRPWPSAGRPTGTAPGPDLAADEPRTDRIWPEQVMHDRATNPLVGRPFWRDPDHPEADSDPVELDGGYGRATGADGSRPDPTQVG